MINKIQKILIIICAYQLQSVYAQQLTKKAEMLARPPQVTALPQLGSAAHYWYYENRNNAKLISAHRKNTSRKK